MDLSKEELVDTIDQVLEKREQMKKAAKAEKKAKADKDAEDAASKLEEARALVKAAEETGGEVTESTAPEGTLSKEEADELRRRLDEQDALIKSIAEQPQNGGPLVGAAGGAGIPSGAVTHPRGLSPDQFASQRAEIQKGEAEGRNMQQERMDLGRRILEGVYEARGYSTSPVQAGRHTA